ncbi:MAG TPA: branched-chain amino acid ABC transporter ATP-binding protein/permease [bacterium]|nr:branched-chain amino acid ABC transporter ATP-binding protein/permease [bacterium]
MSPSVLVLWIAAACVPLVVHNAYLMNGLILACIYGTAAQAWNLLGGYGGQLSFGHAVFFGAGAYTSTLLLASAAVSPWAGMWIGAAVAAAVALIVGYPTFRLRRHYFALGTLALAELVRIVVLNWPLAGGAVGLYLPVRLIGRTDAMMWRTKPPYYELALALLALACALAWLIDRTRLGLYLRAVDQDEGAAQALGVPTRRYKLLAIGLSAGLTALAGSVFAQYVLYIDPSTVLDSSRSVLFAVMALLGGRGTVIGPVLGAGFLTLLSQYAGGSLGGLGRGYDYVVYGLAIMIVAVYEPRGLVGLLAHLRRAGAGVPHIEPQADGGSGRPAAPHDPGPAVLEVRDLAMHFGGVQALRGVTLDVKRGEIVGILGPNGAGKSTLFDCVTGFLAPSGGRVMLRGGDGSPDGRGPRLGGFGSRRRPGGERPTAISGRAPAWIAQQGLARTFQLMRVFPALTVTENLLVGQEHRGESLLASLTPSPPAADVRGAELLRFVGLAGHRGVPASALSYGQQKLLSLAMALMRRPRLVLLDEPVAGVNLTVIERIKDHIRAQNAEGVTFLIIEHNMDVVMELADRLYFLAEGRVVTEGPPDAIQRNEEVLRLYYGR